MENFFYVLFLFYLPTFTFSLNSQYHQIMSDFSFNTKEKNFLVKFRKNFIHTGDSVIYPENKRILLLPNIPQGVGIIKSLNQIDSDNFEIQVRLNIELNDIKLSGFLFYIWLYNKDAATGNGVLFHNKPFQRTKMFYYEKINTDINDVSINDIISEKYEQGNACSEYLNGRDVTLTLRINNGQLNLYYTTTHSLLSSCFYYATSHLPMGLKPPFYFGIGSINSNEYRAKIEIKKITLLNQVREDKYKYKVINLQEDYKISKNPKISKNDFVQLYYTKKNVNLKDVTNLLQNDYNQAKETNKTYEVINKCNSLFSPLYSRNIFSVMDEFYSYTNTSFHENANYKFIKEFNDKLLLTKQKFLNFHKNMKFISIRNNFIKILDFSNKLFNHTSFLLLYEINNFSDILISNIITMYVIILLVFLNIILLFYIIRKINRQNKKNKSFKF